MKKQIAILSFFFALCLMIIYSCSKSDSSTPTPAPTPSISGTWNAGSGNSAFILTILDDNTYSYSGAGVTLESGTYTLASPVINFKPGSGIICPKSLTSKYNYVVTSTTLVLAKLTDSCAYRAGVFTMPFTRQ